MAPRAAAALAAAALRAPVPAAAGGCPHPSPGGGSYLADVVPVRLPTGVVEGLLAGPGGSTTLALAPELRALPDTPVLFSFGLQSGVCDSSEDPAWLDGRSFDLTYHEFTMTVPGVVIREPADGQPSGPLVFTPRLYLNDSLAMVLGWVYGADKVRARFTHGDDGGWAVSDWENGRVMLSLATTETGSWAPLGSLADGSLPRLVTAALDTAVVGLAQGPPGAGSGFMTCFDRKIASADTMPTAGTLGIHAAYMKGLPTADFAFTADTGGMRLRTQWTQSFPNDCTVAKSNPASLQAWLKVRDALPAPANASARGERRAASPPSPSAPDPHKRPECTHPPGAGGGGGAYLADFVVVPIKTRYVKDMLPPELELTLAQRLLPYIPTIFVFGLQYGVCNNAKEDAKDWLNGRAFLLTYDEFIMALPGVQFKDKTRPSGSWTFQPRLYLNDSVAMTLGWGFGIDKVLAHFEHDESTGAWQVADWDTKELTLSLDAKNTTGWIPVPGLQGGAADLVESIRGVMGVNTPILGRSQGGQFYICGDFDWQFSDNAEAQMISGALGVHRAFVPSMPLINYNFTGVVPKAGAMPGAVRIRTNWSMSFPNDCSDSSRGAGSDARSRAHAAAASRLRHAVPPPPPAGEKAGETRPKKQPRRLAVLGTGLGAMSAVYYLTNYTGWEQDWTIDVYQLGWRMGGKGASGRTMSDESGSRIIEHGLHIFFGFYWNTYQWVKDMYAEWAQPEGSRLRVWEDAFKPSCNSDMWVNLSNSSSDERASSWSLINQEDPTHNGWQCNYNVDAKPPGAPTPWGLITKLVRGLNATFHGVGRFGDAVAEVAAAHAACRGPPRGAERARLLAAFRALQGVARAHLAAVEADPGAAADVAHAAGFPPKGWCNATKSVCSTFNSRCYVLYAAIGAGLVADDVALKGFDQLNGESLEAWLCRHDDCQGLEKGDLIRGLFNGVFGYINGKTPNFSAGNMLHNALMAGKKGDSPIAGEDAILMRMQAGMGEVLFTPAYEVLKRRGVRFHFFHKVEQLRTGNGTNVDEIDITVQATVKQGEAEYDPLFEVNGIRVWPDLSSPAKCDGCSRFFDQLAEGDAIVNGDVNLESYFSGWKGAAQKTLRLGDDYDMVLNGITSGALPLVSGDLAAKNDAWRSFVDTTKTVATISLQVWTYNTTKELGYVVPDMSPDEVSRWEVLAAGGPEPYDTLADMTHLAKYETSNAARNGGEPGSVQYFVSPIELDTGALNYSDPSVPAVQNERAFAAGVEWLERYAVDVYPAWAGRLYESMVAPKGVTGRDRLRHQYWRTNFEPTEQYVLSVAGSIQYRPTPFPYRKHHKVHPFENMAMAGDHTRNGLNLGCAEAAVSSGFMAAYGLTGKLSPSAGWQDYEHIFHPLSELDDPFHYPLVYAERAA